MSKKVRNRLNSEKLKKPSVSNECTIQMASISFNFKYITKNKNHNFSYHPLPKEVHTELLFLFQMISNSNWLELQMRRKTTKGGYEALEYCDMKFTLDSKTINELGISGDTKLFVFRFGNKDAYRLIGLKAKDCSATFYVLAIDYDFSAYDHGS